MLMSPVLFDIGQSRLTFQSELATILAQRWSDASKVHSIMYGQLCELTSSLSHLQTYRINLP